jgi:hypothetical protein
VLLSALLLKANRFVGIPELAEVVWDGDAPRAALQTYVQVNLDIGWSTVAVLS